jgi:hypothetical protein
VDALGAGRHATTQQTVASFAGTEFSAILGWRTGDRHWSLTVSGYVPTGNYDAARIAQTGLNRPSLDIKGAYTFLSLQSGLELSAALGVNVNAINAATNYQSGAELHVEWTLARRLPFGLSAGVGGYFYQRSPMTAGLATPTGLSGGLSRPLGRSSPIRSRRARSRSISTRDDSTNSTPVTASGATPSMRPWAFRFIPARRARWRLNRAGLSGGQPPRNFPACAPLAMRAPSR